MSGTIPNSKPSLIRHPLLMIGSGVLVIQVMGIILAGCSKPASVLRPLPSVASSSTEVPEPQEEDQAKASNTSDDVELKDEELPDTSDSPEEPAAEKKMGCWERVFGTPPSTSDTNRGLSAPVPGCPDCDKLWVGPKAEGLHPQVLKRLRAIEKGLPPPEINEPLMWVNSGKREGSNLNESMHIQGLAIDLVICGLNTLQTAKKLRQAGFSCVIEYYDSERNPCNMAHADLRNTKWAKGAYAPGRRKSRSCPKRSISKKAGCENQAKRDWSYGR